MRIYRRELLREFATVAAASAFFPTTAASAFPAVDSSRHLVRLDHNESPYGPCEHAKAAFHDAFTEVSRYPGDNVENRRSAIAAAHGVQAENVTLGCGSTEVLRMTAETFLGQDRNLVIASPTFDCIANAARVLGAEIRAVPLTRDYAHDLD